MLVLRPTAAGEGRPPARPSTQGMCVPVLNKRTHPSVHAFIHPASSSHPPTTHPSQPDGELPIHAHMPSHSTHPPTHSFLLTQAEISTLKGLAPQKAKDILKKAQVGGWVGGWVDMWIDD